MDLRQQATRGRQGFGRSAAAAGRRAVLAALALAVFAGPLAAQSPGFVQGTLPGAPAPSATPAPGAAPPARVPATPFVAPPGAIPPVPGPLGPALPSPRITPPATAAPPPSAPPPAATAPAAPATGLVMLNLAARFATDGPAVTNGLTWRVFADRPGPDGRPALIVESQDATPAVGVRPGTYVVHASLGLASLARRITVRDGGTRETFIIPAGGVRFRAVVGDATLPANRLTFDVYTGSQFVRGEKRRVAEGLQVGDVLMLAEGTYHVVSNYGDNNAMVRTDFRVQPGRLTDATVHHRAAQVTLKLVSEAGGMALAGTAWSVLTPGGDVIKDSIGAYHTLILQEGDYTVIARHDGRTFTREFRVDAGPDREVEVVAR